jgi:hypothetical protein
VYTDIVLTGGAEHLELAAMVSDHDEEGQDEDADEVTLY